MKVKKTFKRFWWAFALVFVVLAWVVRTFVVNRRLTKLGDGWLKANMEYQEDLLENSHNKRIVREIEHEYLSAAEVFVDEKLRLEEVKRGNDQSLSDAWNRAFGHTSP